MQIIADAKKYQLSNGQIIIVKKISVRQFYLLIMSLIVYKNALYALSGLKEKKKISEYIEYLKMNALNIAKVKIEESNLKRYIKESLVKSKFDWKLMLEIINNIVDFNSIKLSMSTKEIEDINEINEEIEIKVGVISMILGKTPKEILNYPNYDMTVLYREFNRNRVNTINDNRVAQHSEGNTYLKYTKALMGEIVYSGDEIAKNPGIIKKEFH